MRLLGFYWGIAGVIGILLFAMFRLSSKVIEMTNFPLSTLHWIALVIFAIYMAYAEGYKGFYLNFAPRVVARANCLREPSTLLPGILPLILAPLVCMGYIYATRKRQLTSLILTVALIGLVIVVGFAPQPWRGIIDVGVVIGLGIGILSIVKFCLQVETGQWSHPIATDLSENIF